MGYKHKIVNHFRGCSTAEGVHTNHVESLWRALSENEIHEWSKAFLSAVLSGRMAMAAPTKQRS